MYYDARWSDLDTETLPADLKSENYETKPILTHEMTVEIVPDRARRTDETAWQAAQDGRL